MTTDTRKKDYINRKYALYASPTMDKMYEAHDNVVSLSHDPVMFTIMLSISISLFVVCLSCGVKTSAHDWFKVGVCGSVIIVIYIVSISLPFLKFKSDDMNGS